MEEIKEAGCGCLFSIIMLIGVIILAIIISSCSNSLTEETWNNGICTECETRYELKAASYGVKYYACPECGQEVKRY